MFRPLCQRSLATLVALFIFSAFVSAQEVDQRNDPVTNIGFGCGSPPIGAGVLLQSFVPSASELAQVDLQLRGGSSFAAFAASIRILENDPKGTEVGKSSTLVEGSFSQGDPFTVTFLFDPPVAVDSGSTYLIEWAAPPTTTATWLGSNNDPYASGTAYQCFGGVWPGGLTDFNFITYSPSAPADPKSRIAALAKEVQNLVDAGELHPKKGRALLRPLQWACFCLGRDRTWCAYLALKHFKFRTYVFTRFGCLDAKTGYAWLEDACSIEKELRASMPKRKRHRWRH